MTDNKMRERLYHSLVSWYLYDKYGIEELDRMIFRESMLFEPVGSWDDFIFEPADPEEFRRKMDTELVYLTLANRAHVDRLSAEEQDLFQRIVDGKASFDEEEDFFESTYRTVLKPDAIEEEQELLEMIGMEGTKGSVGLVFAFHDETALEEDGRVDIKEEKKKEERFQKIRAEYMKALAEMGEEPVYLYRKNKSA